MTCNVKSVLLNKSLCNVRQKLWINVSASIEKNVGCQLRLFALKTEINGF